MWYAGWTGAPPERIGLATSTDGINWVKHGKVKTLKNGLPVDDGLKGSPEAWDGESVTSPCVTVDGSLAPYEMWYTGVEVPPSWGEAAT
jgi:hypothetical protein